MRNELIKKLDSLSDNKPKQVWSVYYKNNILTFPSGKSSWSSIGASKNALRNYLYPVGDWRKRLEEIKKLEDEELIKYVKLL